MATIAGSADPDILEGTALSDLLQGLASDDVLYAFDGNDLLQGGDGDDILFGGSGNDTIDGGAGEDLFFGQSGIDTATYATSATGFSLVLSDTTLSTGDAAGDFFLSVEKFILGGFDDTLLGGALGEDVHGGAGNDLLFGFGGTDALFGDGGNDTLAGGDGVDLLDGGGGTDLVTYADRVSAMVLDLNSPTEDVFVSIEGVILTGFADTLRLDTSLHVGLGGAGNDSLNGGTGADSLFGGDDDDVLNGGNGQDLLEGGDGNDRMFGGAGGDAFVGGAGDEDAVFYLHQVKVDMTTPASGTGEGKGDTFSGIEGLVFVGEGSVYVGGTQDMTVALTGASLSCIAGAGAETFQSSFGDLSVSYQATGTRVSFSALGTTLVGTGGALGDTLGNVTRLTLTNLNDSVNMVSFFGISPTTILAGKGNDTLQLLVTSFAQLIDGGEGRDTITGTVASGLVQSGTGNDLVTLTGVGFGDGDLTLSTGSGNDVATLAFYGSSTVDLGSGNDQLQFSNPGTLFLDADAGSGNDTVTGSASSCVLDGGDGDDVVTMDILINFGTLVSLAGGAGDDQITLTAGFAEGTDVAFQITIDGGIGQDVIVGVDGGDFIHESFVFTAATFDLGWGADQVTHFDLATDLIVIDGTNAGISGFGDLGISGDASHTFIVNGSNQIELVGVNVALIGAEHFVFV